MKIATLGLILWLGSIPAISLATPSCDTLGPCVIENGIAVLGDDDAARVLLSIAQESAMQFQRYMGVPVPPVAIVPGGSISPTLNTKLADAGFQTTLPWISNADKQKLRASSIEKQVRAQTAGLPEAQRQAILAQALGQASSSNETSGAEMTAQERGAFAHELGHLWFKSAFSSINEQPRPAGHGYGGWAPDWLDEIVAILMENDELRSGRRNKFANARKETLYPLPDFLSMDHPALASATELAKSFGKSNGTSSRAIVLTGDEAEAFLATSKTGDPTMFYTQAQGFIDYLSARTGDSTIFADIARHLGAGGDFKGWLAKHKDMPDSVDALTQDWERWLDARVN
ncbi:MAG: hypothetical protein AB8F65_08515 [Woeseiaceae bacterium]